MPYKDPQKRQESQRNYRQKHRVLFRERAKAYYLKEREAIRERRRVYRQLHRDLILQRKKAYREAHLVALQMCDKVYYQNHRDRILERRKVYKTNNLVKDRVQQARRRARKQGLPATLTVEQWLAIQVAYKHRCAYCGSKPKKLTQDHVVPLSKGGGTTPDNIVPACTSCNSRKHAGPPPLVPSVRLLV